jgi:UDP-4-amino-4,6-dideoxy-N-acetyl-beta-L-altrosamine transaminase
MDKKNIPYGRQWIDSKDIKEVEKVLRSDWLTQGPKVEEFEKSIAEYCGVKYAVAVSSGTAALHSAYAVAGIKAGDEVITTPLTFAGTANMLVFCGAKPVFADVENDTGNIDPNLIERLITKKTKAIVPVDFAGHPCDYDKIFKIAKKHRLLVLEDAAHSLGSEHKGRKVGSFADMTILSFHPVKTITTGEGGMVLTNDEHFYKKLKVFRHHGMVKKPKMGGWYYQIERPSFNYRVTDIQCALGISQMKKINKFISRRRKIVARYNEEFKNIEGLTVPAEKNYAVSAWHIYPLRFEGYNRKKMFDNLRRHGIGVQVHYIPLNLQPFYKRNFNYKKGDFPRAEKYYSQAISLPLFPKMNEEEINRVVKVVKKYLS